MNHFSVERPCVSRVSRFGPLLKFVLNLENILAILNLCSHYKHNNMNTTFYVAKVWLLLPATAPNRGVYIFFLQKLTVMIPGQGKGLVGGDYLRRSAQQFSCEWRSSTHSWKKVPFSPLVENRKPEIQVKEISWRRCAFAITAAAAEVRRRRAILSSNQKKRNDRLILPALGSQIFTSTRVSLRTDLGVLCWLKCGFPFCMTALTRKCLYLLQMDKMIVALPGVVTGWVWHWNSFPFPQKLISVTWGTTAASTTVWLFLRPTSVGARKATSSIRMAGPAVVSAFKVTGIFWLL